jgi:hypothetical protein
MIVEEYTSLNSYLSRIYLTSTQSQKIFSRGSAKITTFSSKAKLTMEWNIEFTDLTEVKRDIMKGIHECNIRGLIHAGKG